MLKDTKGKYRTDFLNKKLRRTWCFEIFSVTVFVLIVYKTNGNRIALCEKNILNRKLFNQLTLRTMQESSVRIAPALHMEVRL